MSLFQDSLMYLFSAVSGQVLLEGKPLADVKVSRAYFWPWREQKYADFCYTDDRGCFAFEAITASSVMANISEHQALVDQKIVVHHDDEIYEVWVGQKHSYKDLAEFKRQPAWLVCDLNRPVSEHDTHIGSAVLHNKNTIKSQ